MISNDQSIFLSPKIANPHRKLNFENKATDLDMQKIDKNIENIKK